MKRMISKKSLIFIGVLLLGIICFYLPVFAQEGRIAPGRWSGGLICFFVAPDGKQLVSSNEGCRLFNSYSSWVFGPVRMPYSTTRIGAHSPVNIKDGQFTVALRADNGTFKLEGKFTSSRAASGTYTILDAQNQPFGSGTWEANAEGR